MKDFEPIDDTDATRPGCAAGQAALQRLLDGESAWDGPEAMAHRIGCLDCREELTFARSLLVIPPAIVVPSELANKVLDAAVTSYRRRQVARYAGIGVALAASVVVALFLLEPTPQTITESRSVARVPVPDHKVVQKPLGDSVNEARDAIVSLTKRTASETRDTSTGLIPNPMKKDMPDATAGLEPLADARSGAARSVDPLKNSARRAMNLFLRAAEPPNRPGAVQ